MAKHDKNTNHFPNHDAAGWNVVTNTGKVVKSGFKNFKEARFHMRTLSRVDFPMLNAVRA